MYSYLKLESGVIEIYINKVRKGYRVATAWVIRICLENSDDLTRGSDYGGVRSQGQQYNLECI